MRFLLTIFLSALFATRASHAFTSPPKMRHTSALPAATLVEEPKATESSSTAAESSSTAESFSSVKLSENERFALDSSVHAWLQFQSNGNQENFQACQQIVQKALTSANELTRTYFVAHGVRTGYFFLNAFAGVVASDFLARRNNNAASPLARGLDGSTNSMTDKLLNSDTSTRLIYEAVLTYEQECAHVASGVLKYPWDSVLNEERQIQFDHKQVNPLFALSETAKLVTESIGIFGRKEKGIPSSGPLQSSIYPEYYLNDFHFQTDGWMSTTSAERYEVSTETLFLGRQDAMQRQTLIPLLKKKQQDSKPIESVLEVACGTGRFATFCRDNLPDADMTLTDLSPFYLEKARENDEYWREYTARKGGNASTKKKAATIIQGNAETLPFEDNSFDAVLNVYLFHELPPEARKNVAAEMVRVCKPGGMIVLSDSHQMNDRPDLTFASNFAELNEPHYLTYLETELADLFVGETGQCECHEKYVSSVTKTLSFIKK